MNYDLIQKLIKLANNNPNDNEANLAARKACKMLDGHKFTTTQPIQPIQQPVQPTTWNDVKRSTEPEFKSTRDEYRANFNYSEFFDFLHRAKTTYKSKQDDYTIDQYYTEFEINNNNLTYIMYICTLCGGSMSTKYNGPRDKYICYICAKRKYEK